MFSILGKMEFPKVKLNENNTEIKKESIFWAIARSVKKTFENNYVIYATLSHNRTSENI